MIEHEDGEAELGRQLDLFLRAAPSLEPPFRPDPHHSETIGKRLYRNLDWSQPAPEPRFTDKTQHRLMMALRASRDARGLPYRPDGWLQAAK